MLFVSFENWVPFDENDGLSVPVSNGLRSTFQTLDKCVMPRVQAEDS